MVAHAYNLAAKGLRQEVLMSLSGPELYNETRPSLKILY